ncbi:diguanylate cyclase [Eubacteriaceae bacterium ES3]|nr:diguanylate cyclase [Eubacteriaceae bacterium ES3]
MTEQEFTYLYDLLHTSLPTNKIPDDAKDNTMFTDLVNTINHLRKAAADLSYGNLSAPIEGPGYIMDCLKNLQSSLKTLSHTAEQLAEGDFTQHIEYFGDFGAAFNTMTDKLKAVIDDLTETQARLQKSEARHRLLADHADDVIWTMDLNGRFTYVSPSVEKLRGFSVAEVLEQTAEEMLCPGSLIEMQKGLERAINSVTKGLPFNIYRGELEQPCKDGSTVWTEATVSGIYDEEGKFVGMLGVTRDISERRKMEEEIRRLSITDKLTQTYNRLKLDESIDSLFSKANSVGTVFSIIILDIDHFKNVNDRFGHQAGDQVLIDLVGLLNLGVRDSDIVGRWGGEEFLIILPETNKAEALIMAERLRASVADNHFKDVGRVTISLGVTSYNDDLTPEQLISRADSALYQAKQNGRNRVENE